MMLRLTAGLLLAAAAAACSSSAPDPTATPTTPNTATTVLDLQEPPSSEQIALVAEDFPHAADTVPVQPLATAADLTTYGSSLAVALQALEQFDNGYKTWHMSPADDGIPQSGAVGWVLSFKTMAGAQDAFLSLAEPKRAYILPEALLRITGERELPMLSDGDASRVFDVETRTPLSAEVTMAHRVLYRKGRVVVMVTGAHPASPEYFMDLVVQMLDRVPESDPPSEPAP